VNRLDQRRRDGRLVPVTDRFDHAGCQQLGPHFPEQTVRWIDIGAVDLAIDGKGKPDDIVLLSPAGFRALT